LLLDDVHDLVAHVPQRLRPEPRLAIVTGLQCEHVAAQLRHAPHRRSLGLTSSWGILRYHWTIAKLLLIASVILVGALVIDGALDELRSGGSAEAELIGAASWDVVALTAATTLAVYKPGRRRVPMSSRPQSGQPREDDDPGGN
jgi:hypothetical protein